MFIFLATFVAILALFGGHIFHIPLLWLWASFLSLHFLVGFWPLPGRTPYWRRDV